MSLTLDDSLLVKHVSIGKGMQQCVGTCKYEPRFLLKSPADSSEKLRSGGTFQSSQVRQRGGGETDWVLKGLELTFAFYLFSKSF